MTTYDYSAFADEGTPGDLLTQISTVAEAVQAAEAEVAEKEGELAAAKERYRYLAETTLPELMEKAKMERFRTRSGLDVAVKEDIRASLPKERQAAGFHWLRQNGHDAIIKTKVTVEFEKGHDKEAVELNAKLRTLNHANSKVEASVHAMTLTSFVKELVNKGEAVPTDIFNVFRQRVASVK